jgi:hypothetical protein
MLAQGFTVFAVTEIRRAGKGLPVYLDGGSLDGSEEEIPLGGAGVIAARAVPDGCGAERVVDYFYEWTTRKRNGRVVCRCRGGRDRA